MKIANTNSGGRIAMTEAEYISVGSPSRLEYQAASQSFLIAKDGSGYSMYVRPDCKEPYHCTFPSGLGGLPKFGTEKVTVVMVPEMNGFKFSGLKMNNTPIEKDMKSRKKGRRSNASVPIAVRTPARSTSNLEGAVAALNSIKESMPGLILSVDEEGYIEASIRVGRPRK